jgi:dihydroxyacetone kinase
MAEGAMVAARPGGGPVTDLLQHRVATSRRVLHATAGTVSLVDATGDRYVNEYCTSLDIAGASLTLVELDDEIDELLGAPAEVPIRVF